MKKLILTLSIFLNIFLVAWILFKHYSAIRANERSTANDSIVTFTINKYKTFALRKDFFKANPIRENDIVFAGNSLIENFPISDMIGKIKNRGMSGDNSNDFLKRLDEITLGKPSKLFIMEGINDLGQNIPEEEVIENFKKIIEKIKRNSPHTTVYIYSILPVLDKEQIARIESCNTKLKQLCISMKVQFIDLFPAFFNGQNIYPDLTVDGIHLTPKGYSIWVKSIENL